jgi:branched-chain amino acid transport system substrate-binding protein
MVASKSRICCTFAAGVTVALLAAGCSSSSSGGSKPQANGSSSSAAVKVMIEGAISGPVYALPEMVTGAKAAVARLNSQGGVNGHKIELVVCDDQGNPNNDAACGRKAVSEHVVAAVGSLSIYDTNSIPALEKAKIPYFASTDINPIDHTSPVSFPINASATDYTGEGALLAQDGGGCTVAATIAVNQPGTTDGIKFIKDAFLKGGGKTFKQYLYPPTTTNFTSYVATALSGGAKCLSLIGGPQAVVGILTAIKKSGSHVPVNTNLATIVPALYAPVKFPSGQLTVDGTYYVPGSGVQKPTLDQFVADMKAQGATGEAGAPDTLAENSYQGVLMFALAAKGVSDLTGPNLLAAVSSMNNVDTGLTPAFDLTQAGVFPGYPQDRDNHEVEYRWTGSDLQYVKDFVVSP